MEEDSTGSGITITLKGGAGCEAPWVVIHARTVAEGGAILDELRHLEAFPVIRDAAREFQSATPTQAQATQAVQNAFPGSQAYQQGQVLPQTYQPGGNAPSCAHGPMQYVPNGRYGPFWACPAPRSAPDKCKARNAN